MNTRPERLKEDYMRLARVEDAGLAVDAASVALLIRQDLTEVQ
jgi:hypothetical protein